ncbi:MAG: SufD family Fe-S cluster assembly protein, partial [Oscillospiraceae bacterium]|nr:SufD family Fe-S cluster assembly protein [Oscillospiraceae bacterium]
NTVHGSVHIPVVLTKSGFKDRVYNDFYVGEGAQVEIVAGCGINNCGCDDSQHDGIHTFHIGKNASVIYKEKHYGEGTGTGKRILNPVTEIYLEEGASITLDTSQIRGVDDTKRYTKAQVGAGAEIIIQEKLCTHQDQTAVSEMDVFLNGAGAKARVISRSVAQDSSSQTFYPRVQGNAPCFGHVSCDAIIMGQAKARSIPEIACNDVDATLIHEAAIGRISGEQILKLLTLGLTEEEAEEKILEGFLR